MRHLTLAALFALAAMPAAAADQVRSVAAFNAIDYRGAMNLVVEAGKAHSVTVQGDDTFINRITSEVVNGELRLAMRDSKNVNLKDSDRVVVTVPRLDRFTAEGAGLAKLSNIQGERFDADYRGAGKLDISGKVGKLRLKAQGVGEVDAQALKAQEADVRFEGIGSVKVRASERLDATVRGMGELRYFGRPRIVNKSAAGFGSVTAGD